MPTSHVHFGWVFGSLRMLRDHFRGRPDVFLGSDMLVIHEQGNGRVTAAPDLFVSFGVPPGQRASYRVSREGKPPDVVWEFASPSTAEVDAGEKKEKYRRMGVQEYWLVDPVGKYHRPRLQGFELVRGAYVRMPWEEGPDGMVAVWSPQLHLEQRLADGLLCFWDREAEQYRKLKEDEERQHRLAAEARTESAKQAQRQAEACTERERRARREAQAQAKRAVQAIEAEKRVSRSLEARVAELEAELKRTRSLK